MSHHISVLLIIHELRSRIQDLSRIKHKTKRNRGHWVLSLRVSQHFGPCFFSVKQHAFSFRTGKNTGMEGKELSEKTDVWICNDNALPCCWTSMIPALTCSSCSKAPLSPILLQKHRVTWSTSLSHLHHNHDLLNISGENNSSQISSFLQR